MTTTTIKRIVLAVEHPDLEQDARRYCAQMAPGREVIVVPLDDFLIRLDTAVDPESRRVLVLYADEDGRLQHGTPILQSIMRSPLPVLVLRKTVNVPVPEPHFKRIVVPLDGSESAGQAIPVASQIARLIHVPVRFVMVIDPSRVIPPAYAYDPDAWSMMGNLRETANWALSQAESTLQGDGVTVSSELLMGPINSSLAVSIGDGDLVVMTTRGPDRDDLRYKDSVALHTLVSVSQPMLVMQAQQESPVVIDAW